MEALNLQNREKNSSNSARKERRKGLVPGVLYGKGMQNLLFEVGELELDREISITGQHGVINVDLDGTKYQALLKEVQRDAVNHNIIHIDLEDIEKDALIQSEVPITFVGEDWLSTHGVVLQKEKDLVKVECSVDDLPKSIKIDVSQGRVGSVFRYADLEIGAEISIVDDIKSVVASISNERKLVSELGAEEVEKEEKPKKSEKAKVE